MDEEQRRLRAIELLRQGRRPSEILRELDRSREWLAKWRRRFDEAGAAGLRERSRAHHAHPRSTPARTVRAVLAARDRLSRRRGRQRFGRPCLARLAGSCSPKRRRWSARPSLVSHPWSVQHHAPRAA